ncbi:MAG: HD domain-containing phosphohydrolase [Rectinemataceae bacterium]|jgi:HD-GYP domain-containing protein (c-di-GMP phosphodiesterase class II)
METTGIMTTDEGPPLYSSNITITYLKLIKSRYSYVNITELLAYAGMEPYQVEDEGHWFTQTQVDRFHERLVRVTGNPGIAREAGRYNASPEGFGFIARYVFGLAGPAKVFETIGKLAGNFTRSTRYESKRIGANEIELTVIPSESASEKPYQCENRIGYFEAIVAGFNYRLPKIEHPECAFKGGTVCRYNISWRESKAARWKRIRNVFIGASVLGLAALLVFTTARVFFDGVGVSAVVLLLLFYLSEYHEKRELSSAIDNLRSTTGKFLENTGHNYNHALMINEIGHIISKYNQIDTLFSQVIDILRKRLDYDRGLILLTNHDRSNLEFRDGYGYGSALVEEIRRASFHLNKPDSRGVFVLCYRERKPFLINDVEEIEEAISLHSLEFLRKIGSKSFICCPIIYEDDCLGVLAVDNVESKRPLLESDINLLMGIAPEIGISVHNALLTEEQERQFRSILRTLAASIDARDNLTAGHSERVTEYAMAICRKMAIPRDLTEVIRVASQLHDYGKIGIKDSILKKSGPLTGKEREEIKTHVVKTQDILERINFNGVYQQVPFIAGSHHERLDGTGYPRGLKGGEIPLGAKIIAVADFFEAITAKRHYHEPQTFEEAIITLKKEGGHHLDEAVIQALLASLREGKIAVSAIASAS